MDADNLYDELMALCALPRLPFRYSDQDLDGRRYRIFSYSAIASWEDFQRPGALECRGHTFEIDADGRALRLSSLPMPKFFNVGENPSTQGIAFEDVAMAMEKLDGSLISTMLHGDEVVLKSKGSLGSDQVRSARDWLSPPAYQELRELALAGFTVNLEWVSPENHVVVPYGTARLVALNARAHDDGRMRFGEDIGALEHLEVVSRVSPPDLASIAAREGIEGYVLVLNGGGLVKAKTSWYYERHRLKSATLTRRGLWQLALAGELDDVRALYASQAEALARIDTVEREVRRTVASLRERVEGFFEAHADLERKDYALAAKGLQGEDVDLFPLIMRRYTHGRANST